MPCDEKVAIMTQDTVRALVDLRVRSASFGEK